MEELYRLNKYLSDAGVCSRRAADAAIEAGEVTVNGEPAVMGMKVTVSDEVRYKGQIVSNVGKKNILLAYNKPAGIVCTAEKREKNNIIEHINYPERIYPIGRLDKDSTGLILLTNQGDLVNKIMKAVNAHEKEYIVTVDKDITADFIKDMSSGVYLEELDVTTRKCRVTKTGPREFRIVLTQGLNRQIRRMCQTFGYRVRTLKRVRIMNIELGNLKEDTYRDVNSKEIKELMKMLEGSKN
ncbi:23S rRNA pseudouridine2604 synthase [Pseudobutyrivibrio sp. NOR37]|uniref:Pseudouridine synthase n=1 Tax=Pseudobutyrivibrio xylanivorans TaxID=185007 RepID=A0A6M0LFX5_PSEXY|nr:pseudouridine synthase [Pseudobutyrivibrio sp. NOR37]NEX01346.1 pseudouridine synthase [Pseudobutyrivibrio xylanivorans]SFR66619.1 23S rRNA pseudouridine2604 synthase [Pseudobutyrivibrio sp. NOR37]